MYWWNKEPKSDQILRVLIQKTGELDRLPTFEEVSADSRILSTLDIAFYYGSFSEAMEKVAGLLFGHPGRKSPEDLVFAQRNLSPEEQEVAKREQRARYEENLKLLSQPGGLQQLRKQRQEQNFNLGAPASKVTRIPTVTRKERLAAIAASKQVMIPPKERPRPVTAAPRPKPRPQPIARTPVPTRVTIEPVEPPTSAVPTPNPIQKEVCKVSKTKGARYTNDDILQTVKKLLEHFNGTLPSQPEIKQYLEEHSELASYKTMLARLGPKKAWPEVLENGIPPKPEPPKPPEADTPPGTENVPDGDAPTEDANGQGTTPPPEPPSDSDGTSEPPEPAPATSGEAISEPANVLAPEQTTQQVSIPLPGIAGKLKLEVELDETSLTLRLIFK